MNVLAEARSDTDEAERERERASGVCALPASDGHRRAEAIKVD